MSKEYKVDPNFENFYDPREHETDIEMDNQPAEPTYQPYDRIQPQAGEGYCEQPGQQVYAQQPYAQQAQTQYYSQPMPQSYSQQPYAPPVQPQYYSQPMPQSYAQQPYAQQPYAQPMEMPEESENEIMSRKEQRNARKARRMNYDYDEQTEEISVSAAKRKPEDRRQTGQASSRTARDIETLTEADIPASAGREKKSGSGNGFGKFLLAVQLLLTCAVGGLLVALNLLPFKYLLMAGGCLLGLWLLMLLMQKIKGIRGFGKFCCVLCILALGAATFYLWQTNSAMDTMFSASGEKGFLTAKNADEPFVVYLTGNDSYGEIEEDDGGRSDVNILMAVNPATGKILMVTTPRDYYISLPEDFDYAKDKLTHASIYGLDCSMEVLENLYGTDIDYSMRINFSGFQDIVDALDGVNVYSDYSFTTSGGCYFEEGYNQVNGEEALAFVRERYAFSEGDFQRGRNQMAMIKAIIDKTTSPAILMNYQDLLGAVEGCVITDLPQQEISALVKLQLGKDIDWDIQSVEVKGYVSSEAVYSLGYEYASVVLPDEESVQEAADMIRQILNGE